MHRREAAFEMETHSRQVDDPLSDSYGSWSDVVQDEVYTVRDGAGQVALFRTISILEVKLVPNREHETLATLPPAALSRGSIWTVSGFP
jgi:hypothetical protein